MALTAGDKLGPYEILGLIGAGGMGEVYMARDPRLGRDVAIKVSTAQFTERFEREARSVAALNHPKICHLYDVGPNFLVMELIEGPTLAERIASGAIPLEESLKIAAQIADALEAAHEKGITHRDLKPANIKIKPDGTVKVLDFGLAKVEALAGAPNENSPTLSMAATQAGVILGTAAYMGPEQASGKPVDKRADIWSFGVVLWEMLTGNRMFSGETVSHTLAAVLIKEPDWTQLPAATPASIRRMLRRCLERDLKRRLLDIGSARLEIEEAKFEDQPQTAAAVPPSRSRLGVGAWIAAGILTVSLVVLASIHFRERAPVPEVVRFQIPPPGKSDFTQQTYLLSPDARKLAFGAAGPGGASQLWVRSLDTLETKPLAGTENATAAFFWSPDSRSIGFATNQNRLRRVDASGGPPQTVCDLPAQYRGGAWSSAGVIIFGSAGRGLMRVSEAGGTPAPLTGLTRSDIEHSVPAFLPDQHHFLYFRRGGENTGIYIGSLDAKSDQQGSKRLLASDGGAAYALLPDSKSGHILFGREGSLMAQPFDPAKLETTGDAVPIAEGLPRSIPPPFSASLTGVLAYRAGTGGGVDRRLTWFDRTGKSLGTAGEPGDYNTVSLSPDGAKVAVSRTDGGNTDVVVHEFAQHNTMRLTFDPALDMWAVWSPDGSHIIFSSAREGPQNLYRKTSSGAGAEELVFKSNEPKFAQDWSRDGRFLLYSTGSGNLDLWVLPLDGEPKPQKYVATEFNESQGRFSPDGRFVAYSSNASGRSEVYVQPFPNAAEGKWMVSTGGGSAPRWRRDGKELYYTSADSKIMAVEVSTTQTFKKGVPKELFSAPIWGGGTSTNVTRYDVTADGQRFLINAVPSGGSGGEVTPITVILNWPQLLKK